MYTIKVSDDVLEGLDKLDIYYEYGDEKIVYKNSPFHESMLFIFGVLVGIIIVIVNVIYTGNPCTVQ